MEIPEPAAHERALADAVEAVRREYRESTRPAVLECAGMTMIGESRGDTVFRLNIAGPIDFDWTWEGSVASRIENDAHGGGADWHGEVVEVDAVKRHLYVAIAGPAPDERPGRIVVEPFPFVRPLAHVYGAPGFEALRARLGERLHMVKSGAHPLLERPVSGAIAGLQDAWRHRFAVLWGPPGTGKTFAVGEQVAEVLASSNERLLVVSTTNKATDAVALSIGAAMERRFVSPHALPVRREGAGADYRAYERAGLLHLLAGEQRDAGEARRALAELLRELRRARSAEERARLRAGVQPARRAVLSSLIDTALDERVRVTVATAYGALALLATQEIAERIADDRPPFSTVILDEAGLVSRAAAAALSLLGKERMWLVGDPRQLAPITRISRVLPAKQAAWLGESGLGHLRPGVPESASVAMLRVQHRMHPHIREVISRYQYGGSLEDAPGLEGRRPFRAPLLREAPRAMWYVLDEDGGAMHDMRAERGPGGRSWIRPHTKALLQRLFSAAPELARGPGLFVTPFVAQAQAIDAWLADNDASGWIASTVHAQQGAEADFVIFDTVNAGSYLWPPHEWERIVNVALSRARELVMVLASRKEMQEIYLRRLKELLAARVLTWRGRRYVWSEVQAERVYRAPDPAPELDERSSLGAQLAARKLMSPVPTREQQRLCAYTMDGKPRLVRGVAGSGKTVILASWLAQTAARLRDRPEGRIWVVYGNRALGAMLWESAEEAWRERGESGPFPRERVEVRHVLDVLHDLRAREGLRLSGSRYDYEAQVRAFLDGAGSRALEPLCDALFVDEAQDLGHETLRLLFRLVAGPRDDPRMRNIIVFFDNAQNVYGRTRPTWSELGLDVRGRSTVLKESYRSTRPICELALNVLYRLAPLEGDADHKELVQRDLIERVFRGGRPWWRVRFNDVQGPWPRILRASNRREEIAALAARAVELVRDEGVQPADIRVLYQGKDIGRMLLEALSAALRPLDARAVLETSQRFTSDAGTLVITTPQSFKGYDAEIVLVASADRFGAQNEVFAPALYVALTRARSILEVYCTSSSDPAGGAIVEALEETRRDLARPDDEPSPPADRADESAGGAG